LLNEIYDRVKHDIPNEFKKKYEYSGRGQLNLPLPEDSESFKYVMSISKKYQLNPTFFR
jgi:hypothetical protein